MTRIAKQDLWDFCYGFFEYLGAPVEHAKIVADGLIDADLKGIHSHGVNMMATYTGGIKNGAIKLDAIPSIKKEKPYFTLIDAQGGLGHVAAKYAMQKAIEKAGKNGIGLTGVYNANHFGTAGFYGQMAVEYNMIGFVIANTPPFVAPTGGTQALFGTNPICIAFPAGSRKPIISDMATSQAAMNKVLLAKRKGETIPEDWVIDEEGTPITDPEKVFVGQPPKAVFKGTLLPMAGHKGYALTIAIDNLCALICGAKFSDQIKPLFGGTKDPAGMGYLLGALDIKEFTDIETYNRRIKERIDQIKNSPKAKGVDEIFLPGEIELNNLENRLKEGIPLQQEVINQLNKLAESIGFEGRLSS